MPIELNAIECRVIGCLMEKSVVTPDQYPLTLNSLTNACNQKSSRQPVMSLDPGEVQRAIRSLQDKHLIVSDENFKTQTEKYAHRFCNTPFSDHQFDESEFSIICTLLLRGPRTPGELRANSGRLHTFADNQGVVTSLNALLNAEGGAVIAQLPRAPGRKDSEYVHLFSDTEILQATTTVQTPPPRVQPTQPSQLEQQSDDQELEGLKARISALEAEVAALREAISSTIPSEKNQF